MNKLIFLLLMLIGITGKSFSQSAYQQSIYQKEKDNDLTIEASFKNNYCLVTALKAGMKVTLYNMEKLTI